MEPRPKIPKKRRKSVDLTDILETQAMENPIQFELREAAEKNVLRYLIALIYDQAPKRMLLERGITFTPMCPDDFSTDDPAAFTACLMVDFDNSDPSALNANFLAPASGKNGRDLNARMKMFVTLGSKIVK